MNEKTEYEIEREKGMKRKKDGIFSWLEDPNAAPVLFFASQFFHHGPGPGNNF